VSPPIDVQVVDARLRELPRPLERLASKRPASLKALRADEDLQDIVTRNLELGVQCAIDIAMHLCAAHGLVPTTAADAFDHLAARGLLPRALARRLRRSVSFRNVLVHEYVEIDWRIVMDVLEDGVADLTAFGRHVVQALEKADRG
jgi:uncharacterized protein YutE (UPF0331/DUF86 family)